MTDPRFRWGDFVWLTRIFSATPKERDYAELSDMQRRAASLFAASPLADADKRRDQIIDPAIRVVREFDWNVTEEMKQIILRAMEGLAEAEPALFETPPRLAELRAVDLREQVRLRERLRNQVFHFTDFDKQLNSWQVMAAILVHEIVSEIKADPVADQVSALALTAPLISRVAEPVDLCDRIISLIQSDEAKQARFFLGLVERIFHNMFAVNHITLDEYLDNPKLMRVEPHELFSTTPIEEAIATVFAGTPFEDLLLAEVPIVVPEKVRFEHMHMLAGTGHGKTQTLQHLIVQDLLRSPEDVPSMVILDSQGDMLDKLSHLPMFDPTREGSLARRLLIVDPSDVAFAPALNLFDIRSERLADYSQRDREQVLAGIIEIYDYVFSGLLGAELTQKQSMVFRFLVQLMLAIPGATIHTLRDLLIDASPFMPYVAKLPDTARGFFETQFFSKGYAPTREQVLRRLYGVLQNPSFERMFATPHNRLDLFDTLNSGGIVLVNTAKDFMKSEASGMFGRFIIALTLKAAMERAILREEERRPTFLWIDEASEYFDDKIDDLLIQARKYKLGLVMAHQYLGQLPRGLPASIMTNTSIKLAGGLSDQDARLMAREMRTTPEFINALRKGQGDTSFAAYVRNVTPQALKLTIPFGTAEHLPRMPDDHFEILRNASRQRLSVTDPSVQPAPVPQEATTPEAPPIPAATIPRPDDDRWWQPY